MITSTASPVKITHIAVDPGHVGGNWFDLRRISTGIEGGFREGDFTYAWAEALAEAMSAGSFPRTLLTRKKGTPSKTLTADEIRQRQSELEVEMGAEAALKRFRVPKIFYPEKTSEEFFPAAVQNEGDLKNRAIIVNKEAPDFCLSLHLNGDPTVSWTTSNGICGFTTESSKAMFPLFKKMIESVAKETKLPVLESFGDLRAVSSGLFIDETLTLLRNLKVPVLLLEGPFQNNEIEVAKLSSALKSWENNRHCGGRLLELTRGVIGVLT